MKLSKREEFLVYSAFCNEGESLSGAFFKSETFRYFLDGTEEGQNLLASAPSCPDCDRMRAKLARVDKLLTRNDEACMCKDICDACSSTGDEIDAILDGEQDVLAVVDTSTYMADGIAWLVTVPLPPMPEQGVTAIIVGKGEK